MYMNLAEQYAQQSPCKKRKVGCVIIKDDTVIAYGFNHGYDEICTCSLKHKNPDVIHAEQMALQGTCDIYKDADIYITYQPCMQCAKLIVSKKIKRVFYAQSSKCTESLNYLNQQGISTQLKGTTNGQYLCNGKRNG